MSGKHANSHLFRKLIPCLVAASLASASQAQVTNFGNNAQHTMNFSNPAGTINNIHWVRNIDDNPSSFGHYGAPIISAAGTIFTSHKLAGNAFQIEAIGSAGGDYYTLSTDYVLPSFSWVPPYQVTIAGDRLYYPGKGGRVFWIDNIDTPGPKVPNEVVFYGAANYAGNPSGFDSTVFINTPLTSDSAGNVYFGFRMQGTAPGPFLTNVGGYAKITPSGVGSWIHSNTAANDATMLTPQHGSAPAISNDEQTLYGYLRGSSDSNSYIVGIDTSTMTFKYSRKLWDPRNNGLGARCIDQSTASPMVGPDGDVFAPVFANPYNGSRGWLLHFSGDLVTQKTTGAFGWDYTPGIVPATMVPSYDGNSSYLLFCKYNNYSITDGDGVNRVALLDPNETQVDFHPTAPGMVQMRSVLSIISPAPDAQGPSYPLAVREWCINASAVNPSTNSILFNCEDGRLYRWRTDTNVLSESVKLNEGILQPYVPTVIAPDGRVVTLNGAQIFMIGGYDGGVSFTVTSDKPNMRTVVAGESITFTAKVHGIPTPTGTFEFRDLTNNGLTPETNVLATGVAVDGNGEASITVSTLSAGGAYFGNHIIEAEYSVSSVVIGKGSMLQKVHANSTTTTITPSASPSNYGDPVVLTANVSSAGGTPTGYVTFYNNGEVIGQTYLDGSGNATLNVTDLGLGSNAIGAVYESDTHFATSTGAGSAPVQAFTTTTGSTSPNPSTFGQTVTMSATVTADNPSAGTPTGTVTFKEGTTVLGSGTVDGSGNASATISTLSVGSHNITAEFTGTGGWVMSSGSCGTHDVTASTSTSVGSSANPSNFGQNVTFTATVTSAGGTPTGSVVFTIDGVPGSPVSVDGSGQATTSTSSLSVGGHSVSAAFTGTGGYGNSNSSTLTQNVQASTSTSVSGTPNPSNINTSVTFTATVTSGAGTPTGTVTFKDGTTTIGSAAVNGSGQASINTSSLSYGSHTINAEFAGTGGWQNSSGNTGHTVNDNVAPSVPVGVSATPGPGRGNITVSWSASTDVGSGVNHYEVWRSNKINGTYSLIASPTGTSYLNNAGVKKTWFYYVIAVDAVGNKSGPSAKVSATAPNRLSQ